ncbi:hypothetical protein [Dechloromonas sp. CZR5]|uniref:hypothetical protein n=1 Tax=Dechloromonas sp. CZR5 TaxID=2608630 RepID=UPI00123CDC01|nr:hypothetical protein [Dechloromonas sp. CZR5]
MTEVPVSVPIIAATIGAGAALLGTALSFGRDWFVQRLKDGQQRTFVAIRLAAELEDFAIAALKLAQDLRVRHGATPYISSIDPDDEYDVESHLNDIVSDVLKSKSPAAEMTDC